MHSYSSYKVTLNRGTVWAFINLTQAYDQSDLQMRKHLTLLIVSLQQSQSHD